MDIEELAFKDGTQLAHLNELDLLLIIEFLQKDRKEWINQFTKTHNESVEIQEENQALKKQLHEASITIQEMVEQDIECPSNCEKLRQLKKQLEENKDNYNCLLKQKEQFEYIMSKQVDYLGTLEDRLEKLEKNMEQMSYKVGE